MIRARALRNLPALMLLVAVALVPFRAAQAEGAVAYGPVPESIAGVIASERDQALAANGLAALEHPGTDHELATSLLIMLEDVGLRAVATHLAEGRASPRSAPHLLEVIASSEHPDADLLLARAAEETRPVLRMIAADGLGRGRSPRAAPILARLVSDAVPGVRIAALRSLFAIESPQALAARLAAPADREPALLEKRLTWHTRCQDVSDDLRALAETAYAEGSTVSLRMAAARYLALPSTQTDTRMLQTLLVEMAGWPPLVAHLRRARGQPVRGYEPAHLREVAIEAALTLLSRSSLDPALRARLIDQAIGWVAHPVELDSRGNDPIPEVRLRRRLPDFGPEILPAVLARLQKGEFYDPRQGVILIRELGAAVAVPALHGLLTPRAERPPLESRAEFQRRRYVRTAAAGALQDLGQVGDEALARALLFGPEPDTLKTDILYALEKEPGSWAVALLGEVVAGEDPDLRFVALDMLERRSEAEARTILVDDLFARMDRPHLRMAPLVHEGDEAALRVAQRALRDERPFLRKAALSQFLRRTHPKLCGPDGRAVLLDFLPDPRSPQEIQGYVYALLNTDAERAVRYVRENWSAFPTPGVRMTSLRLLGEARGPEARKAAVDFALTQAGPAAPLQMLLSIAAVLMGPGGDDGAGGYGWVLRAKDADAFYKRLLFSDDVRLQRAAIEAYTHEKAPDEPQRLLFLLSQAVAGEALPPESTTPEGEQAFARLIVPALVHQDWKRVEPALLDLATNPLAEGTTRTDAAWLLVGRLSETGRARLLEWLDYTQPPASLAPPNARERKDPLPGTIAEAGLQLFLAAAVGTGGDATVAALLHAVLKRELFAFFSPEKLSEIVRDGPGALDEEPLIPRISALARGVGSTRDTPTIEALLDLVFDLRFALYARTCVRQQAATMRIASTAAAAITPSPIELLTHQSGDSWRGMPTSVYRILDEVKSLDDEVLAAAMERVLQTVREDGRLSHFPTLYFHRVLARLLEPHTGRKPKTAAVVLRYARRSGRLDAPQHFPLAADAALRLADEGRFADAALEQQRAVRILARGNLDDPRPGLWRYHRAIQDALEAAALAQRGEAEGAASLFLRAGLRAPSDPDVQNTVAWYRARADFGLEQAEAGAEYATRLEARVDNRPGANAADTFAYVLLKRGRPWEGLRVLAPRMGESRAKDDGVFHLHMAQLYASVGRLRASRDALVDALTWDRALEDRIRVDPYLAPVRAKVPVDAILKKAAEARWDRQLP